MANENKSTLLEQAFADANELKNISAEIVTDRLLESLTPKVKKIALDVLQEQEQLQEEDGIIEEKKDDADDDSKSKKKKEDEDDEEEDSKAKKDKADDDDESDDDAAKEKKDAVEDEDELDDEDLGELDDTNKESKAEEDDEEELDEEETEKEINKFLESDEDDIDVDSDGSKDKVVDMSEFDTDEDVNFGDLEDESKGFEDEEEEELDETYFTEDEDDMTVDEAYKTLLHDGEDEEFGDDDFTADGEFDDSFLYDDDVVASNIFDDIDEYEEGEEEPEDYVPTNPMKRKPALTEGRTRGQRPIKTQSRMGRLQNIREAKNNIKLRKLENEKKQLQEALSVYQKANANSALMLKKTEYATKLISEHFSESSPNVKKKIILEMDRAKNIREAKFIYNNIDSTAKKTRAAIEKNLEFAKNKGKKVVTEQNAPKPKAKPIKEEKKRGVLDFTSDHQQNSILGDIPLIGERKNMTDDERTVVVESWQRFFMPQKED